MLRTIRAREVYPFLQRFIRCVSYVQGQAPSPHTREYFYYIDHQGQLFLDDARLKNFITCFKDKKFLEFFFKRVKPNASGCYEGEFPYVSPCGREMNYIRCDDLPLVFTHLLDQDGETIQNIGEYGQMVDENSRDLQNPQQSGDSRNVCNEKLSYGGTGKLLTVPFQPDKLCMLPESGRVYHAGLEKLGGVGLVKSSLAIELSWFFVYESPGADENSPPTKFVWRGRTWDLDISILHCLKKIRVCRM